MQLLPERLKERIARPMQQTQARELGPISQTLVTLMAKSARLRDVAEVSIQSGEISIRVQR